MNLIRAHVIILSGLLCAATLRAQEAPPPETRAEKAEQPEKSEQTEQPRVETSPPRRPGTVDRLELDTTAITGNRELPRVLYIVPWKKSDLGDLTGRPANSLLDEVLAPVDREVFRRQTAYHETLNTQAPPDADNKGSER